MPGWHLFSVERDAWLALFPLFEKETSLPGKRAVVGTCPPEKTFKGGNVVIGEKVLIGTFASETTFKNFLVRLAWTIFPPRRRSEILKDSNGVRSR